MTPAKVVHFLLSEINVLTTSYDTPDDVRFQLRELTRRLYHLLHLIEHSSYQRVATDQFEHTAGRMKELIRRMQVDQWHLSPGASADRYIERTLVTQVEREESRNALIMRLQADQRQLSELVEVLIASCPVPAEIWFQPPPPPQVIEPPGGLLVAERNSSSKPPTRVVNTGITHRQKPEMDLDPQQPLAINQEYWFFVEVGKLLPRSMEEQPTPLPPSLPKGALLTVSLFALPGQLELTSGADEGVLRVTGMSEAEVAQQPGPSELRQRIDHKILARRLLFPIRTPSNPGQYCLRCNIYFGNVLLQSRIIRTAVGAAPTKGLALRSRLDYKLSYSLDPEHFTRLGEQRLSILFNSNDDATHGFFFFGGTDSRERPFKSEASVDAHLLQDVIKEARKSLRRVAWGNDQPWREGVDYRYKSKANPADFKRDLETLAIRGYMSYDAIVNKLSGGSDQSTALAAIMRSPGRVQISSNESARMVVPAALLYDYPLDTEVSHTICDAFERALDRGEELELSPCFTGNCPHYNDLTVVCPGGFWGYRHEIGLPVSIGKTTTGDAAAEIDFSDPPSLAAIVSLDSKLIERSLHEQHLQTIRKPLAWRLCEDRKTAFDMLQHAVPQIVYFYCHGGMNQNDVAFLEIGNSEYITADNIRAYGIRWISPRPLVFLNGCMTTALEPEKAFEFVTTFISNARASGVIGTEITVFEPLATKFAELFLQEFLCNSKPLGCAVRRARLALLRERNPLGLVYLPFALPGLRMGNPPNSSTRSN